MKKYLLALVFVCSTAVCLSQDVYYGIRGAINNSNLNFDPDPDFDNETRNGFAFGGFVDFGFSETVSVLTELQWSAEGGKDESLRADYIKLPILLRYNLSQRFTIGAGPQLALKTWEANDNFTTFSFAGVVGVEYLITDDLFIDLRYTFGLSNVLEENELDSEAINNALQFGFGIKI